MVCPPTLVGHWPHEIHKFVGSEHLRTLAYEGTPPQRAVLRKQLAVADVVIMSYETLRSDADWVAGVHWNYCVLDEGHIIRNPRSKVAQVRALGVLTASSHDGWFLQKSLCTVPL